jgi:peptide methionine sulfoxide reductase MsrA
MMNKAIWLMFLFLTPHGFRQSAWRISRKFSGKVCIDKDNHLATATFAGGVSGVWNQISKFLGVAEVISGYIGGREKIPPMKLCRKGYIEAVQVKYDRPKSPINNAGLFLEAHRSTDPDGQFVDQGPQYRSAIFYQNESEKQQAGSFQTGTGRNPVVLKPLLLRNSAGNHLLPGEDYHQDYYKTHSLKYKFTAGIPAGSVPGGKVWKTTATPAKIRPQEIPHIVNLRRLNCAGN